MSFFEFIKMGFWITKALIKLFMDREVRKKVAKSDKEIDEAFQKDKNLDDASRDLVNMWVRKRSKGKATHRLVDDRHSGDKKGMS